MRSRAVSLPTGVLRGDALVAAAQARLGAAGLELFKNLLHGFSLAGGLPWWIACRPRRAESPSL